MVNVREKVDEGWFLVRVVLEMAGKPAQHVKNQMDRRVEIIKKQERLIVITDSVAEIKKVDADAMEHGMAKEIWTTFAEIEMLVKNYPTLLGFCFEFMPSSIEFIEPSHVTLRSEELTDLFTDLQSRLLQVDVTAKQVMHEAIFYKQNITNLFKNYLQLVLHGGRSATAEEIASLTGVAVDNIKNVMDILIDKKKVEEKDGKYRLLNEVTNEQSE